MNLNTRIQPPMMSRPQASKPQAQRSGGGAESLAKQATEEIEFRQNWGKMKLIGVLVKMQEYATKKVYCLMVIINHLLRQSTTLQCFSF